MSIAFEVTDLNASMGDLQILRGVDLMGPGRAGVYINLVPIFAALFAVLAGRLALERA